MWLILAVLLAVPYVVTGSSDIVEMQFRTAPKDTWGQPLYRAQYMNLSCQKGEGSDCEWLYDLAFLLNEAHERRTVILDGKKVQVENPGFEYKQEPFTGKKP